MFDSIAELPHKSLNSHLCTRTQHAARSPNSENFIIIIIIIIAKKEKKKFRTIRILMEL